MNFAVIENGKVVNVVVWGGDPESWQPPEGSMAVEVPPDTPVTIGTEYANGEFVAPPPPPAAPPPTPEQNAATRDALLAVAAGRMAPLQDAVDLEEATDAELALLKKWKQYRVALNRVDLSAPAWPEEPAS